MAAPLPLVIEQSFVRTCVFVLLGYAVFLMAEPAASFSASDTFTVGQVVSPEITFTVPEESVTLAPAISGLTGGEANGAAQIVIRTNNQAGYFLLLRASSSLGMHGDVEGGVLPALVPTVAGVPDFAFDTGSVAPNSVGFGYTIEASTTPDLDESFLDDTGACSTGSADTPLACWLNASTSDELLVDRTSPTLASGSTTTLRFRVVVAEFPSPVLVADTYRATTTLTASMN